MEKFIPRSYYYRVTIDGDEMGFSEVTGLQSELVTEEVNVGGWNSHTFKLPIRVKHSNLVLKRAINTKVLNNVVYNPGDSKSKIYDNWIKKVLYMDGNLNKKLKEKDLLKDIAVYLIDPNGEVIMSWTVMKALPVKWNLSNMNAKESAVAIETIEFVYQTVVLDVT